MFDDLEAAGYEGNGNGLRKLILDALREGEIVPGAEDKSSGENLGKMVVDFLQKNPEIVAGVTGTGRVAAGFLFEQIKKAAAKMKAATPK